MLALRLLFRKLFMVGPHLLSLLDAGIAPQGLITQVINPSADVLVTSGGQLTESCEPEDTLRRSRAVLEVRGDIS